MNTETEKTKISLWAVLLGIGTQEDVLARRRILALTVLWAVFLGVTIWFIYDIRNRPPITYERHRATFRELAGVEDIERELRDEMAQQALQIAILEARLNELTAPKPSKEPNGVYYEYPGGVEFTPSVHYNYDPSQWWPDSDGNAWQDNSGYVCETTNPPYMENHSGKADLKLVQVVQV